MPTTEKIQIPLEVLDKATKQTANISKGLDGVEKSAKRSTMSMTELNSATMLVRQGFQMLKQAYDFGKEGALIERMGESSAEVFRQMGGDVTQAVDKIREASLGAISDYDAMALATRAAMLGVSADSEQLGQLMQVAAFRGRAMGISTTQAFQDIATGIGRQSPLILDNLGIITKGWAEEAKAAGQAYDQQFILNKVLEQGAEQLEKAGGLSEDTATSYEQLGATLANATNELKKNAGEGYEPLVRWMNKVIENSARMSDEIVLYGVSLDSSVDSVDSATRSYMAMAEAQRGATVETEGLIETTEEMSKANSKWLDTIGKLSNESENYKEKMQEIAEDEKLSIEERQEKTEEYTEAYELNAKRRMLARLEEMAAADGLSEDETRRLEDLGVKWGIYTEDAIEAAREMRAEVELLSASIVDMPEKKRIDIILNTSGNMAGLGGVGTLTEKNELRRDSGGRGMAGMPYLIGSGAQPELFVPDTAGTFHPNADKSVSSGGGNNVEIDYNKLARTFTQELQRFLQ